MSLSYESTVASAGAVAGGSSEAQLAGSTLAGRYDVLELLGVGGMGAVYRARDRELDELVALKVIKRDLATLPAMVERFRHEVKLARRVTHVNVARTFELGTTSDGTMFCTMELVEGESLAQRISQRGALPVGEAVAIACALCDGLAAAHAAGVIHRDIKPDNVLLAHDGRVVIADFGVAAVGVGGQGELAGTPAYMAPEQKRGEPATAASDIYSLGVVVHEMLAGERFGRRSLGSDVPEQLAGVVAQAMAEERGERIATARALRRALEPWATATRRATAPIRAVPSVGELASIVVVAPRAAADHPRSYLATAVHEQLLARLAKKPRLRVLPRPVLHEGQATFGVCFDVGEQLGVTVTLESGPPIALTFPLAIEHVDSSADAIAATVDAALTRVNDRDARANEARELLLRARHIAHRDFTRMPDAIHLLHRARELAPNDARVAATLAIGYMRAGFFVPTLFPDALSKARALATTAVTAAPELADAHIACGHLELNMGNPVRGASHFRIAISRAPQLAEAHEQLGRMLLEAGYLTDALARLDEAIAIAPDLRSAVWEIARAHALDGRWDEHDRLVREMTGQGLDRPLSRARYAWWRGDWATVAALRSSIGNMDRVLWPGVVDALFDIFLDKSRWAQRDESLFTAVQHESPNKRRRVYIAQLACEAAAFAGDADAVVRMLGHATADGLFDLHWLNRCVLLQPYQDVPGVVALRREISERAAAILDALYGDHAAAAVSATQVA